MSDVLDIQLSKSKLIDISTEYFVKFGYRSAPLSKIAEEANLDKSTIYHYFKSKTDLAKHVLKNIEKYHEKNLFSISNKRGISPEDRIFEFIGALKLMILDVRLMVAPIFMLEHIPELDELVKCHRERWITAMKLLLAPLYSPYLTDKLSRTAWRFIIGTYMEIRTEPVEGKCESIASDLEYSLKQIWFREIF